MFYSIKDSNNDINNGINNDSNNDSNNDNDINNDHKIEDNKNVIKNLKKVFLRRTAYISLTLCMLLICIIILNIVFPFKTEASSKNNNYLVVVQNKDSSWTAYENLVEKSPKGNLMVKAKLMSKALDFTYNNYGSETFTIQCGNYRYNTYTKGEQTFCFRSSSDFFVNRNVVFTPYTSKESNYNMCHVSTLGTLVNYKYYTGSEAKAYKIKGYTGVVCYSKYGQVTKVPSLYDIVNTKGDKFFFKNTLTNQTNKNPGDNEIDKYNDTKLIIVGDSRTNNMSRWAATSVNTEFVAKNSQGYQWFNDEGINKVNSIKSPGDIIIIWLGINDFVLNDLSGDFWITYADKINSLACGEWSDCKVFVAEVGYVDENRMKQYYGEAPISNDSPILNDSQTDTLNEKIGVKEFNDNLRANLIDSVTWVNVNEVIGINNNNYENTPDSFWVTRSNGQLDGLHYGRNITQEIYNYFVKKIMK